jgi:DNA invertase Pin-like site-specific DNA recombinase
MSFTIWLGQHEYFPQDIRSTMPELNKLLQEATQADVLLVESVDRLSRLTQHDFNKLKKTIQEKELHY